MSTCSSSEGVSKSTSEVKIYCIFVCFQANGGMRVREIPIIREGGQGLDDTAARRHMQRPAMTKVREIPIQRDLPCREHSNPGVGPSTSPGQFAQWPRSPDTLPSYQPPNVVRVETQSSASVPRGDTELPGSPLQQEFVRNQPIPVVCEPAEVVQNEVVGNSTASDESSSQVPNAAESLQVEPPVKRGRSPSPAPANLTALEVIDVILEEASKLRAEVEAFTGKRGDKPYLLLEEMLTRLLIKLDRVDSEGREDIRNARRDAVRTVQSAIDLLDSRTQNTDSVMETQENTAVASEEPASGDSKSDANRTGSDPASVNEMVLSSEVQC